jgi:hypothetical protein
MVREDDWRLGTCVCGIAEIFGWDASRCICIGDELSWFLPSACDGTRCIVMDIPPRR